MDRMKPNPGVPECNSADEKVICNPQTIPRSGTWSNIFFLFAPARILSKWVELLNAAYRSSPTDIEQILSQSVPNAVPLSIGPRIRR